MIISMVQTKLFLDLYLVKFLDTSAKLFFPCTFKILIILRNTHVYGKNGFSERF